MRAEVKAGNEANLHWQPHFQSAASLLLEFEQPGTYDSALRPLEPKPPRKVFQTEKNTPEATFRLRDQTAFLATVQACGQVRCSRLLDGYRVLPCLQLTQHWVYTESDTEAPTWLDTRQDEMLFFFFYFSAEKSSAGIKKNNKTEGVWGDEIFVMLMLAG